MSLLIARSTRNLHRESTQRALSVIINLAVGRHEAKGRRVGLTLGGADKCLRNGCFVIAIDGSCRPFCTVLTITDARAAIADAAKLTTGTAVEPPPHTSLHAILHTYHCLADIMQLVGIAVVAIVAHFLKEVCIGVERTSQLMGASPVDIGLYGIIPRQSLVAVQRIASGDEQAGIAFLQLARDFLHVGFAALLPVVIIGLVERRNTDDAMLWVVLFNVVDMSTDHRHPVGNIRIARGAVPAFIDACLLVGVQDEVDSVADEISGLYAAAKHIGLTIGQRCVADKFFTITEATAHNCQVLLADMVDTHIHISTTVPGCVHTPANREFHALVADAVRYNNLAIADGREKLARR